MKNFNNKVVVVTGAGSGMGRAYALAFAKENSCLALCDFNKQGLMETCELVSKISNVKIYSEVFDVSQKENVDKFANNVASELGNAHIVINNAGIEGSGKPSWAVADKEIRKVMEVNFYGVVYGTLAFLPQLKANNEGAIINVSSLMGLIGSPNHSEYSASKFAVRGYTESLMCELINSPIQVHLVHPGGIKTNISNLENTKDFSDHFLQTPPEDIANHVIQCIKKNKTRIVYGNGSFLPSIGTKILPLKLMSRLIWNDMKKVIDLSNY